VKLNGDGERDEVGTVEDLKVGISPGAAGIAVGEGGVWIANADDGTVVKLDAKPARVAGKRRPVGDLRETDRVPMVAARGGVWIGVEDSVVRLDPRTGKVAGEPIQVGGLPESMDRASWGPIRSWCPSPSGDGTLVGIDTRKRRLTGGRLKLDYPRDIAFGAGALWVTRTLDVQRLDARTGRPAGAPIRVGESVTSVVVGEGAVWVTSPRRNAIYRVDPTSREISEPIVMETENAEGVSAEVGDLAVGLGAVWVGSELEDALHRIDPGGVQ
jgi:streptogramin lyase